MKRSVTTASLALGLLLAGCGDKDTDKSPAAGGAPNLKAIPAPNGGDWTQTVTQTKEGGFLMGNPDAPVKLVEFGSMSCSHCADFAKTGEPALVNNYVKTGQVSFEFRNFVRDPADLAASLLARCGGATPFFKLTEQMFASQADWIGKLQQMSAADQQRLQAMQPQQVVSMMAQQAGLIDFVRVRGIPAEKAQSCVSDAASLQRLVDGTNAAVQTYQVAGTPTFLINGKVVEGAASWDALEPKLKEAL